MITSNTHQIFEYQKGKSEWYEETFKRVTQDLIIAAQERVDDLDLKILKLVYQGRIITSLQLNCHLKHVAPITIRRHIDKLYKLGCVDCFKPFVRKGSAPIHVVLGPIGARILKIENFRRIKHLGQNWKHMIAVNEIYAKFSSKFTINTWKQEVKLTWFSEKQDDKYFIPDAFIGYINQDSKQKYSFIEVDMGTESIDVLVDKAKNYIEYFNGYEWKKGDWQPGKLPMIPQIIFIMKNEKDAIKLKNKVAKLEPQIKFLFTTFEKL